MGASPNGWRTVEMCEMKKKKHESISHKKKGVMRGFEPEKKRSPLSFPTLPSPVENIRPRDQLTSSSTLGDLATQTLSRL